MSRSMKNPDEDVFPHRDPTYPIQPRIDTATRTRARIVILAVPGEAKFVASTLEDPKVSVSAPTRKAAQEAALRAYVAKHSPMRANPEPVTAEDLADLKIAKRRMKERGGKSIEAIAKKYGYRI